MILEVLIFGTGALWLLALLPAAVIAILKEQWVLFGYGWLTLGILWFVAAASLAPPASWWARRFYDEGKLARAVDPLRFPPRWSGFALGAAAAAALAVVLGLLCARPSSLLGMDGGSLQTSVGNGGILGLPAQPCQRVNDNLWSCAVGRPVQQHGRLPGGGRRPRMLDGEALGLSWRGQPQPALRLRQHSRSRLRVATGLDD